jgi:hypothetical protein
MDRATSPCYPSTPEIDAMSTAVLEQTMAEEKPKTMSVKLHIDVIEAARIVAAYRGDSMTDMLSDILRPVLAKMEREEIAKRAKGKGSRE